MGKLNQVIAVVAPKKAKAAQTVTECYHRIQKPALFEGINRKYQPRDEDGEVFPEENKVVQSKVAELIREAEVAWTELFDVVATQDRANCVARADVKVDGMVILTGVPVTHLLYLEKQLKDVETFISKLPVLDPAEEWNFQPNADQYASKPAETVKTKKVPRNHVKAEATKEHPAQVDVYHEDVTVGRWRTVKFSGAIPARERNKMVARVRKLQEAVTLAREEANSLEAPPVREGKAIFDFIFENGTSK